MWLAVLIIRLNCGLVRLDGLLLGARIKVLCQV